MIAEYETVREEETAAPYVTIVLPCYNEQDHVVAEIERISAAMDASGYTYELMAVDDSSTDETLARLQRPRRSFPKMRVCAFRRNGGSGTVRRIGTQQARGEIVVWTDADMTYPNERIPELVQILEKDPTIDQVVGARTSEQGTTRCSGCPPSGSSARSPSGSPGAKIPDLNSGLRAFRREVSLPYLRLLPPGFSCVTTITLSFLSNQHDVYYLPIDYAKRAGKSKFQFVKRRLPVHPAGAADGDVLQPAQGAHAARADACSASASSRASSTWSTHPLQDRHRHGADLRDRADHRVDGPTRRPDSQIQGQLGPGVRREEAGQSAARPPAPG